MYRVLCSTSGQWGEAVSVYKSTQLQELSDLSGLALAFCKAGLITDSINGEDWKTLNGAAWLGGWSSCPVTEGLLV